MPSPEQTYVPENNSFTDPRVAAEWIWAVENEQDGVRDREIYPRLSDWSKKLPTDACVLEVGSGQGACSPHIDRSYFGVEPSKPLVKRAQELYGAKFTSGTIYELRRSLNDFEPTDAFSTNVWFHLQNVPLASRQFLGVLPTEGSFMIITGNPAAYDDWKNMFVISEETESYFAGSAKTLSGPISRDVFYTHTIDAIATALISAGGENITAEEFGSIDGFSKPAFIQITGTKT